MSIKMYFIYIFLPVTYRPFGRREAMPKKSLLIRQRKMEQLTSGASHVDETHTPTPTYVHPFIVLGLVGIFLIMMLTFMVVFFHSRDAMFMVVVSLGYLLVYAGVPLLMLRHEVGSSEPFLDFLHRRIHIETGQITGVEAWIQIWMIPAALTLATIGICCALWLVRP
jgi:hypothetical protein